MISLIFGNFRVDFITFMLWYRFFALAAVFRAWWVSLAACLVRFFRTTIVTMSSDDWHVCPNFVASQAFCLAFFVCLLCALASWRVFILWVAPGMLMAPGMWSSPCAAALALRLVASLFCTSSRLVFAFRWISVHYRILVMRTLPLVASCSFFAIVSFCVCNSRRTLVSPLSLRFVFGLIDPLPFVDVSASSEQCFSVSTDDISLLPNFVGRSQVLPCSEAVSPSVTLLLLCLFAINCR